MIGRTKSIGAVTAGASMLTLLVAGGTAEAHSTTETVGIYSPLTDGDADRNDVTAYWATTAGTQPSAHQPVYVNWGYANDWAVDIFTRGGMPVVSPFGSRTSSGQGVTVTVVDIRAGCRSGSIADGGYRVTLEARNAATGVVLARADLMHVNSPQVSRGQSVGPWTVLGTTARFRYSSCYQVSNDNGIHVHAEFINYHRYACYVWRSNGAALTENTRIGTVAGHYGSTKAVC